MLTLKDQDNDNKFHAWINRIAGAKTPCARLIMLLKYTCFCYYGRYFARCYENVSFSRENYPISPVVLRSIMSIYLPRRKYSYAVYFHRENQITRLHKIINISFSFKTIIFANVIIRERLVLDFREKWNIFKIPTLHTTSYFLFFLILLKKPIIRSVKNDYFTNKEKF